MTFVCWPNSNFSRWKLCARSASNHAHRRALSSALTHVGRLRLIRHNWPSPLARSRSSHPIGKYLNASIFWRFLPSRILRYPQLRCVLAPISVLARQQRRFWTLACQDVWQWLWSSATSNFDGPQPVSPAPRCASVFVRKQVRLKRVILRVYSTIYIVSSCDKRVRHKLQ
jgi:hypothetical protein